MIRQLLINLIVVLARVTFLAMKPSSMSHPVACSRRISLFHIRFCSMGCSFLCESLCFALARILSLLALKSMQIILRMNTYMHLYVHTTVHGTFSAFADTVPAGARTDQCAADNIIVRQITSLDYGELHVKNYLVYLIWIRLQVSAEKRKRPSYLRICVGMCMSGLLLRVHTMLLH